MFCHTRVFVSLVLGERSQGSVKEWRPFLSELWALDVINLDEVRVHVSQQCSSSCVRTRRPRRPFDFATLLVAASGRWLRVPPLRYDIRHLPPPREE